MYLDILVSHTSITHPMNKSIGSIFTLIFLLITVLFGISLYELLYHNKSVVDTATEGFSPIYQIDHTGNVVDINGNVVPPSSYYYNANGQMIDPAGNVIQYHHAATSNVAVPISINRSDVPQILNHQRGDSPVSAFNYDSLYNTHDLTQKYSFINSSFVYMPFSGNDQQYASQQYFNSNPLEVEEMCKKLDHDTCAYTSSCVYLADNNKCVPGNKRGPYVSYSDINVDYYYYRGKCYGNCPGGSANVYSEEPSSSPLQSQEKSWNNWGGNRRDTNYGYGSTYYGDTRYYTDSPGWRDEKKYSADWNDTMYGPMSRVYWGESYEGGITNAKSHKLSHEPW